jgi:hypothetical protein
MKLAHFLLPAALATFAIGCGGSDDNKYTTYTAAVVGTLQGTILDATTGARIGGDDLKLTLVQGTSQRGPSKLIKDVKDALVGEYAFSGIPVTEGTIANTTSTSPQAVFKLVVSKTGYQPFEAEFAFSGNYTVNSSGVIADAVYNKIGNIYLFPLGGQAASYTTTVLYNDKPVSGATVELVQFAASNSTTTLDIQGAATNFGLTDGFQSNRLLASAGLYPTIIATTDKDGKAVFAGSQLVLGGAYKPVVLPTVADSVQTATTVGSGFVEGADNGTGASSNEQTITLSDAVSGSSQAGLYVASVSNSVAGAVQASGELTIVFNRAVQLNNEASPSTGFGGALNYNTGSATLSVTRPVTATLSSDGLTLVLKPNWTTQPASNDYSLNITYSDSVVTVSPVGQPDLAYGIFSDLYLSTGSHPSGAVWLTSPSP